MRITILAFLSYLVPALTAAPVYVFRDVAAPALIAADYGAIAAPVAESAVVYGVEERSYTVVAEHGGYSHVPEPGTLFLGCFAALCVAGRRRR